MKHVLRVAIPVFTLLVAGSAWIAPLKANELAALNLTLRQTYTKTATPYGDIYTQYMDAFTPTTVNCPQKNNCMVQVQFSVLTEGLPGYDEVVSAVQIDGQFANPSPGGLVVLRGVYNADGDDAPLATTFTWVQVVAPGKHVVTVQLRAGQWKFNLRERTLVIQVYN